MALRVAVVVSQAPGLGGTPSAGQRSTAVANASAAASSAMSRSPKRLARAATTRAHSSWWARVTASWTSTLFTVGRSGTSSRCVLRAPGRPEDLDRHALRVDARLDQVERKVRAGVREQPGALAEDHGDDDQRHLVDQVVLQQPPDQ